MKNGAADSYAAAPFIYVSVYESEFYKYGFDFLFKYLIRKNSTCGMVEAALFIRPEEFVLLL